MYNEEKVVEAWYIKLLALNVDHLETTILMEKNTNSQYDIDEFKELYGDNNGVIIFIIHMNEHDLKFTDYQRICEHIHPFDYVRYLITKKNGIMIHRSDVTNEELYDQTRVTYIQEK